MTALVSAHPGEPVQLDVFMAIGGEVVVEMQGVNYGESGQEPGAAPNQGGPMEISFDPSLSWPTGVPVVVRAAGHWDNTLVAEATLRLYTDGRGVRGVAAGHLGTAPCRP